MPKFSEEEKIHIRQALLAKGKALFAAQGLAKTSIDEIVAACGIAKGSFYKFFASKEELYWHILTQEEQLSSRILTELMDQQQPPKERIVNLLRSAFRMADENPLLQPVFEEGAYERLLLKLPKHLRDQASASGHEAGLEPIRRMMGQGLLSEDNPRLVSGILQAVMLLRLHKAQLGPELFPHIIEKLIDYVAEGLTARK